MPIRFRCLTCHKLLGIATRKAGTQTTCPQCGATLTVPTAHEREHPIDLDEIDVILVGNPAPAAPRPGATTARPTAVPSPSKQPSGERPLFEKDVDDMLGIENPLPLVEHAKPKPKATPGVDALSLDQEPPRIVLNTQQATAAIAGIAFLVATAFAAGYFVGSR